MNGGTSPAQAAESGKPPEIVEKMIDGRVRKFLSEISLVDQPFVKDADVKVGAMLKKSGATVSGFDRFEVGEGIEKEEDDFASEVAKQRECGAVQNDVHHKAFSSKSLIRKQ